ncbi:uncharacterized protein N0V89_011932 [Didymosphaeria variabile]|uniref:F-box domain-containing protein n=1 Tax=Didymosphaeria variabile TaxID=1932322 RepID=A0A9W9C5T1_9PLEO|nr:uncharacterized protein N0V89_011932 [Didymosphaeria variabile]KAJ4345797.1 hypothetical protein N0V89_011932 [Didymosphaeria variabile]
MAGSHIQPQWPVSESEASHQHSEHGYERLKLASDGMLDPTPQGKYVSRTKQNMTKSPLLRLPPELRATIYRYVFTGCYVQDPDGKRFTSKDVAHPSFLSVCRSFYAEARFLPFTNARFIFVPWHIGSAVKGVPYQRNGDRSYDVFFRMFIEQHAREARVFKYSAQSDKIATLQMRTSRVPCLVSSGFVKELKFLPGLEQIILRPIRPRSQIPYKLLLIFDERKFSEVRGALGSSVRVEYEGDDLLEYELLDWDLKA